MDNQNFRQRTLGLSAALVLANMAAWVWAYLVFHDQPVLLGTAFLAYSFGLRHALDADHIAAIDNVTRKLVQSGDRPVSVGFYFALGHSTVVMIAVLIVYWTAAIASERFKQWQEVGETISTCVSACFLFAIALSISWPCKTLTGRLENRNEKPLLHQKQLVRLWAKASSADCCGR
jgi:high-affinity nickel-transport protein